MGKLPIFFKKVQQNVQRNMSNNQYSIGFYTGGIDINNWKTLTFEQQKNALKKVWFIWWKYRNPKNGKLKRMPNIKSGLNRLKDIPSRIKFMREYKRAMIETFSEGYSPFNELEESVKNISAKKALEYALSIKKQTVSERTYKDYLGRCNIFMGWLKKQGKLHHDIHFINRRVVSDYLDHVLKKNSPRTRNNVRADLSSLFTILADKFIIDTNFIKNDLSKVRITTKTDKRLTKLQVERISNELKKEDPHNLLLYIKIVSYNFLRGIEVSRLKVGDIDLETREMYFDQKTKLGKTKYIPEIYFDEIKDLIHGHGPEEYLFTPDGKPGKWDRDATGRREFMGRKLKDLKNKLQIKGNNGFHGFRHYFIDLYYRYLVVDKGFDIDNALKHIQSITGHHSMEGLKKYIHKLDIIKPKDYSKEISELDTRL